MITFFDILRIHGFEHTGLRLVRHSDIEIPILSTFRNDIGRFVAYQSYQKPKKFGDAIAIASFAPHHRTTALFLGIWRVTGYAEPHEFTETHRHEIEHRDLPREWLKINAKYSLERIPVIDNFSERLVIEWGPAAVAWVQSKDKEVIEIKAPGSIGDFQSFAEIDLSYYELRQLCEKPESNQSWIAALSSVRGIYMIRDAKSGRLYVGSGYGEDGIFGRWSVYAGNGHGGNKLLNSVDPTHFRFSILEIAPSTMPASAIINRENLWKEKLGTREFGLNDN